MKFNVSFSRFLIRDSAGNLYGTTFYGGTTGYGSVFKLDTAGKLTVLHSFKDAPDGAHPIAGLVLDKAGNLYGNTSDSVVDSGAAEPCSSSTLKSGGANSR